MLDKGFSRFLKRERAVLVGRVFGGTNGGGRASAVSGVALIGHEVAMTSRAFVMSLP